jgi:hypothetical protein
VQVLADDVEDVPDQHRAVAHGYDLQRGHEVEVEVAIPVDIEGCTHRVYGKLSVVLLK